MRTHIEHFSSPIIGVIGDETHFVYLEPRGARPHCCSGVTNRSKIDLSDILVVVRDMVVVDERSLHVDGSIMRTTDCFV